jgi:hypothetical protein
MNVMKVASEGRPEKRTEAVFRFCLAGEKTGLRDEARLVRVHDSRWFLCCLCWIIFYSHEVEFSLLIIIGLSFVWRNAFSFFSYKFFLYL